MIYNKVSESELTGIDLEQVLSADVFSLRKIEDPVALKNYFNAVFKDLVHHFYIFPNVQACDFLCVRSLVRDDYKNLFHSIVNQIERHDVIIFEDYKKYSVDFNINASKFLVKNIHLMKSINEDNKIKKACLYVRLCSYLLLLNACKKINFSVLVVFADMQPAENLITQFFKLKGKKTVTLQHGLYVDYGGFETVNVINYENHIAEYFLAWGECTGSLIKEYHDLSKVVICGKPQVFMAADVFTKIERKYIYIILDQKIYDSINFDLINLANDLARERGLVIKVKFHPQNDKNKYFKAFNYISEGGGLEGAEFVLGHTSSLLFEAMVLGLKVYIYRTSAPCLYAPGNITFSCADGLRLAIKCGVLTQEQVKYYISDTGKDSEIRYKLFFNDISSNFSDIK